MFESPEVMTPSPEQMDVISSNEYENYQEIEALAFRLMEPEEEEMFEL